MNNKVKNKHKKRKIFKFKKKNKQFLKKHLNKNFKPKICVFKSNRYISFQLIDIKQQQTIYYNSSRNFTKNKNTNYKIIEKMVDSVVSDINKIKTGNNKTKIIFDICVFDRNGFPFSGKVKFLAELLKKNNIIL